MIDLRSDTVTQPSVGMRHAMAEAEVGDDVYGEDPTVNRLQDYAAELLGKESALLLPSGTMANLVAFLAQTHPGDTVILSEEAHPFRYERANLARVAGLMIHTIPDTLGKFTAKDVAERVVVEDDPHLSRTTLVSIENTTNRGGGACWEFYDVEAIAAVCRNNNMRLHCDGARIFNACIVTNVEAQYYARCCDTLSFCLSKGLGAPAGSILAGDKATLKRALDYRKMLGGGMRQSGVLAAAGLYALENHLDALEEDHRRARIFRRALEGEGLRFPLPSPTNILYIEVNNPERVTVALKQHGVRVCPHGTGRIRVVFHRDIDDHAMAQSIEVFKQIVC
ncbi:MAG: aminotransferase class I/II-fold pyridoxal phosphate-dependent enzyme [Candidatus Hydrogenedentes bacterium]|nr:aminotransferase class I/II-fold pyridoxal phosphate-dependent enzyme [Candidatus Hydrogenedentota bacterium]